MARRRIVQQGAVPEGTRRAVASSTIQPRTIATTRETRAGPGEVPWGWQDPLLPALIEELRARFGRMEISQYRIARRARLSRSTVNDFFREVEKKPSFEVIGRLAVVAGTTTAELVIALRRRGRV